MAGAGYKLFATGDVLTAAQVNTYLMQQTVMVFASSAARTSALSGVLAEGMVSYLQDTNSLEVYDGSAWIGATGDITALTAGTGISITSATGPIPTVAIDSTVATLTGSQTLTNKTLTAPVISTIANTGTLTLPTSTDTLVGRATSDTLTNKTLTSPVISTISNTGTLTLPTSTDTLVGRATTDTLTNKTLTSPVLTTPSISNIDAKGDLLAGTADNTIGRLAVGANGTVLTADSAEATGLKWAAAAGGGGLTFIKAQTIGSAVSSVTVTDAFSATYDNYLIIVSGGSGSVAGGNADLTLGSTTSGYYMAGYYMFYSSTTVTGFTYNPGAKWTGTYYSSSAHSGHINLQNPYLAKTTTFQSKCITADSGAYIADYNGFLNNTTSYTAFTLTAATGTMTGGTIRVYGYQNS